MAEKQSLGIEENVKIIQAYLKCIATGGGRKIKSRTELEQAQIEIE